MVLTFYKVFISNVPIAYRVILKIFKKIQIQEKKINVDVIPKEKNDIKILNILN